MTECIMNTAAELRKLYEETYDPSFPKDNDPPRPDYTRLRREFVEAVVKVLPDFFQPFLDHLDSLTQGLDLFYGKHKEWLHCINRLDSKRGDELTYSTGYGGRPLTPKGEPLASPFYFPEYGEQLNFFFQGALHEYLFFCSENMVWNGKTRQRFTGFLTLSFECLRVFFYILKRSEIDASVKPPMRDIKELILRFYRLAVMGFVYSLHNIAKDDLDKARIDALIKPHLREVEKKMRKKHDADLLPLFLDVLRKLDRVELAGDEEPFEWNYMGMLVALLQDEAMPLAAA